MDAGHAGSANVLARVLGCLVAYSIGWACANAGTLVINANSADPAPRAAWEAAVARFQRENPDIRVEFNVYDHESYKKAIRNWLTGSPPDVVFWFAGNRMRQFSAPGLLEDLSELYTADARRPMHPSALELVSDNGRQYGDALHLLPGRALLSPRSARGGGDRGAPRHVCAISWPRATGSRRRGIEPFAIGTRDLWPAAAWFDYLDLRLNGLRVSPVADAGRSRLYRSARPRRVRSLARARSTAAASAAITRRRAGRRARRSCTRASRR